RAVESGPEGGRPGPAWPTRTAAARRTVHRFQTSRLPGAALPGARLLNLDPGRPSPRPRRLQARKHLHPHRHHPEKQRDRRQCGGFLDNGTEHDSPPLERKRNIVLLLFRRVNSKMLARTPFAGPPPMVKEPIERAPQTSPFAP